jgi:hypothetical protein
MRGVAARIPPGKGNGFFSLREPRPHGAAARDTVACVRMGGSAHRILQHAAAAGLSGAPPACAAHAKARPKRVHADALRQRVRQYGTSTLRLPFSRPYGGLLNEQLQGNLPLGYRTDQDSSGPPPCGIDPRVAERLAFSFIARSLRRSNLDGKVPVVQFVLRSYMRDSEKSFIL